MTHKITMHEWWAGRRRDSAWHRWECRCGASGEWIKNQPNAKTNGARHKTYMERKK